MESTEARVAWLLALEDRPFSLNTHYLADYRDKFLAYYKGAREQDRNANLMSAIRGYSPQETREGECSITKVLAGLTEMGIHGVTPGELAKLIPPDGMEPALVIMADVRAYFQGAYELFVSMFLVGSDHAGLTMFFSRIQTFCGQRAASD
jgi:hypothetical protein